MLTNGQKCKATIRGAGIREITSNATGHKMPLVYVDFETADMDEVTWSGFVTSDASTERVKKALRTMGMKCDSLEDIAGLSPQSLNVKKIYDLEIEEKTTDKGTYYNVKWVNDPENPVKFGPPPALTKASALDLLKKAVGGQKDKVSEKADAVKPVDPNASDIPF